MSGTIPFSLSQQFDEYGMGGSIQITFAYHNGDQAIPKARPDTSSTAC